MTPEQREAAELLARIVNRDLDDLTPHTPITADQIAAAPRRWREHALRRIDDLRDAATVAGDVLLGNKVRDPRIPGRRVDP